MASFSAELHVGGYVILLTRCTYGTHQDTDWRGRVITKVRRSLVDGEADVPEHQVLEAWAADLVKRQEAIIIFRNADTGSILETLHLKAAYCVGYRERFVSGDVGSGSYQCFFSLSDPDGWDWYPGALPNEAAIRPAPREHGTPPAPVAAIVAVGALAAGAHPDVPPHLPAPVPNPSPDHAQVHLSPAEWQALTAGRWDRNNNKKLFKKHRQTEFHVEGDPFTYRVDDKGKVAAVYDAQKSYNVTGTRKGVAGVPLTLNQEPTFAGTLYMYPPGPPHQTVVSIAMAGSRGADFKLANEAAGLAGVVAAQGRKPERAPEGYTWHHRDDFKANPNPPPYGTCTMELVVADVHEDTFVHKGACDQCNKHLKRKQYT